MVYGDKKSSVIAAGMLSGQPPLTAGAVDAKGRLSLPTAGLKDPRLTFRSFSGGRGKDDKENEFRQKFESWKKNKSEKTSAELMQSLSPYIDVAVRKWVGSDNPVARAKAEVMVLKAMDRYDPSKAQISTFIDRQTQPLNRWKARKNVGIALPREQVSGVVRLQEAEADFEAEFGRAPSIDELATRTGLNPTEIQRLYRLKFPVFAEQKSNSEEGMSFVDDQAVVSSQDLWYRSVYHSLPPQDQVVMQHTLGLYGAPVLSNQAIAKKLKISPAAVSQRKSRIQRILERQRAL
ncbi:MAG: hypothetical protein KatS3mg109_0018 [Pirellulaceae bacterium]|nr:MAG: hypothetical protein KatS3mg109_0018 [Pirellulaceae bacterium]